MLEIPNSFIDIYKSVLIANITQYSYL